MSITDKIKTLEDVYAATGVNPEGEIPFKEPKNARQKALNCVANAFLITEALNEGWEADYDNNEYKFYPWWYMRSEAAGGPGFSYVDFTYDYSYSRVGARLSFKSRELAKYAAEQFTEVYKGFMLIEKK